MTTRMEAIKKRLASPAPGKYYWPTDIALLLEVVEAAKCLQVFLDEEIGMDKVELTMLRIAIIKLEAEE